MIDHIGIRVADLARSAEFYERALSALGYTPCVRTDHVASFKDGRSSGGDPGGDLWLTKGEPHPPRVHIAFRAADESQVRLFYEYALDAGGADNGAPGYRPTYHRSYFACFIIDPDGYNIEAVSHGRQKAV